MGNKNIALFLDGTWNEPGDNTNVWRTKLMLDPVCDNGRPQVAFYDTGVGTHWYDRFRGAAVGAGLAKNVREAYQWLMEQYRPGDDVYVFGFSRGAFTARSLTGMIAKCGLLSAGCPLTVLQVFERYRQGNKAVPLYTLEWQTSDAYREGGGTPPDVSLEERWLLEYSTRIPVKFIGVWDTVGALGIPGMTNRQHYFHHTRLSKIFEHACHALAVDEHRKAYDATLWTRFVPHASESDDVLPEAENSRQHVEQRWFVGAHSNVGGGYRNDALAQVPLAWIQNKAMDAGLQFRTKVHLSTDEHLGPVTDSYSEFLKGVYKLVKLGRRHHRAVGRERAVKEKGDVYTANEWLDGTVIDRWQRDPTYRPQNLMTWSKRAGIDIDSLDATQGYKVSLEP